MALMINSKFKIGIGNAADNRKHRAAKGLTGAKFCNARAVITLPPLSRRPERNPVSEPIIIIIKYTTIQKHYTKNLIPLFLNISGNKL